MRTRLSIRGGDALRQNLGEKGRRRRSDIKDVAQIGLSRLRNDLLPKLELMSLEIDQLKAPQRHIRAVEPSQVKRVMHSISTFGFVDPVIVDETDTVLDGLIKVAAAKELGLQHIPCIRASHLSAQEKRVVRLALNRLGEKGRWNLPELKEELIELSNEGVEIIDTGFTLAELDSITFADSVDPVERGALAPAQNARAVSRPGDVFVFDGGHRLICGDATAPEVYERLMRTDQARLILTDEPYNVPIAGHVTKGTHREFVMASGEMSAEQFLEFNRSWIGLAADRLCDGGLLATFIDWRGYGTVQAAACALGLNPLNLVVWAKTNGGLGSLYRSQHELLPIYKKGTAAHVNNVELGKNGRWRSNVWTYPGASSAKSDARRGLELHPTVKPEAMCADAILDVTNRRDVVLDPFLGSGSTLLAAQRTGRRCYGIELDLLYVDVAIKRYREVYGSWATLGTTGQTFDQLGQRET